MISHLRADSVLLPATAYSILWQPHNNPRDDLRRLPKQLQPNCMSGAREQSGMFDGRTTWGEPYGQRAVLQERHFVIFLFVLCNGNLVPPVFCMNHHEGR